MTSAVFCCDDRYQNLYDRCRLRLWVVYCGYLLIILSSLSSAVDGAVFSSDPKYTLWPNPARIPFRIQGNQINAQDFGILTAAMNQLSTDTAGCINFVPYDTTTDRGADFIIFRNKLSAGVIDICYTFPGVIKNNGFGQVAVVFGSDSWPGNNDGSSTNSLPGACLDSERDTMRLLMNLLGVRNEHNRNDRNAFLTFQSRDPNTLVIPTLQRYNLFTPYANNSVATIASIFDYNSVTLVTGTQFAASLNQPVFVPANRNVIGQLPRLSRTDCSLINLLYRCNAPCPDPYAITGVIRFNPPTTFSKHLHCAPVISPTFLVNPIPIGDVTVANSPGVTFRYTLTPQVNYLSVVSTTKTVGLNELPAARILLTQIPSKGFVNGQFTLTAISGALQGTTTVILTINCVPQFVASSGGRPNFFQPSPIAQPTTFTNVFDVYTATVGDPINTGIYVNCKDLVTDPTSPGNPPIQATQIASTIGFVTAVDPEGGRVSYYIDAPFPDRDFGRAYFITPDGVITYADNNGDRGNILQAAPFGGPFNLEENFFIGAVDPAGGMSVIHYKAYTQCGPPAT